MDLKNKRTVKSINRFKNIKNLEVQKKILKELKVLNKKFNTKNKK